MTTSVISAHANQQTTMDSENNTKKVDSTYQSLQGQSYNPNSQFQQASPGQNSEERKSYRLLGQNSVPQSPAVGGSLFKTTSLVFLCLWIITMIALIAAVCFYFLQSEQGRKSGMLNTTAVAFSAHLGNNIEIRIGPYGEYTHLVYNTVLINIGNAYDSTTGIFTAPIKGAYHFSITAFGWNDNYSAYVGMAKNDIHIGGAYDHKPGSGRGGANMFTLVLEEGDQISLRIMPGMQLHDNTNRYNTFNGHLLFPL